MSPNPAVLTWPRSGVAAIATPGVTYRGHTVDTSDSTSYTLSGVSIGPADATRVVVISIHGRTLAPTAVTIGGVTATLDVTAASTWVYRAVVPTGTTADIVITSSTTGMGVIVGVWSIVGYTVTVGQAKVSSDANQSHSMTTTAGGALVAVAYVAATNVTTAFVGVGEDYDVFSSASGVNGAGGHAYPTSAGTVAVSATPNARLVAVAYTLA